MKEIVLFITDFFGPNPGGIENFHTGILEKWINDEIILICFDNFFYFDQKDLENFNKNIRHKFYRFFIKEKNYFSKRDNVKDFIKVFEELKKNYKIKHIILGNASLTTRLIIPFILDSEIPYSIILHPIDLEILSFYNWNLIKWIRKAKQVFVYTKHFYEIAQIKGIPRDILVQIPYGLYTIWEQNHLKVSKELKEKVSENKTKFKILTMGPLTKTKRIERVFSILENLKKKIDLNMIHWYIVGTGSEYHYLKEMINIYKLNSVVSLTGLLNHREVGYMYYHSDLYYHPGGKDNDLFSGFCTTILEASYSSLPIVSGSGAGIEELIQNNYSGFILPNEEYSGISEKILELIQDSNLRKRIGQMAEDRVLREFSIERSVQSIFERIYI
ncbi:MAG: glycosyltransferase family 4 protein [Leptonema sp. (in: bacteria)]